MVPSAFLDLCSFVIAHRFSSPKWLDHLKEHISVVDMVWRSKVCYDRFVHVLSLVKTPNR